MAAGAQAAGGADWRVRAAPLIGLIARHRVLAAVIFLAVFPWLAPYKALAVNILIFGLFAMGFNLIYGYAGMLSFGHAAVFGLGAYGCGVPIAKFGVPWFIGLPLGVVTAGLASVVIGWFATRSRGIYFAMVTLALSQVETNMTLGDEVFKIDVPRSAKPITLDELRHARPGVRKN